MKLTAKQQEIIDCLAKDYTMIQSYDFPIHLSSRTYYSNHIPHEVTCPIPTKNKLLDLGLIEFSENSDIKFYKLTDLGRKYAK